MPLYSNVLHLKFFIFWVVDERQVFVCKLIGKTELFYKGDMMKITYINHSGFLIETKDCYYIFDYYKGELPQLDKKKEVIVFCSHFIRIILIL